MTMEVMNALSKGVITIEHLEEKLPCWCEGCSKNCKYACQLRGHLGGESHKKNMRAIANKITTRGNITKQSHPPDTPSQLELPRQKK